MAPNLEEGQSGIAGEATPLLGKSTTSSNSEATVAASSFQLRVWEFLEARTANGRYYEKFMIALIVANVAAFCAGSLFVEPYNEDFGSWAQRDSKDGVCGSWCDALWFGNYADNPVSKIFGMTTSVLEVGTVLVFSVEYGFRIYTARLEGYTHPLWFVVGDFFSWVDLAATLPFYVEWFGFLEWTIASTGFVRALRLFRMMRSSRYESALGLCGAVYQKQKGILGTAAFVGATTWISVASLYYLVERKNPSMIYCGSSPNCNDDDVDTSLCTIDAWGLVDCAAAGCPSTETDPEPCYNLYQSIPLATYYSLLNLFGEFPHFDQHSVGGQIVATLVAVVAVTVFGLPVGIIGNGFESEIEERRKQEEEGPIIERGVTTQGYVATPDTLTNKAYNVLFGTGTPWLDHSINILVVGTALTFMIDTIDELPDGVRWFQSYFEFIAVLVFTVEYVVKFWVATSVDPMYTSGEKPAWSYAIGFLPIVDLLGFLPYWIVLAGGASIVDTTGPSNPGGTFVKALRLLRLFRLEKYTHAFLSFDDIFSRNYDVLSVTLFSSLLLWILFAALLYATEKDNPDPEMAANYNSVPNAMWMTLLNLSGEAPLAQYSLVGKIATGILGLFATAIFGIPIGILGAGFEQVVEEENEDDDRETTAVAAAASEKRHSVAVAASTTTAAPTTISPGTDIERWCYDIVNGRGSAMAQGIETLIYVLIFVAICIGALQTVHGHENDFSGIESLTVYAFTLEYVVRFIGVGADPVFAGYSCGRWQYLWSFYSIIDLLAILPYYIALALPASIIDQYDEYLRMARILRLLKLDKYVPSFTLIDDVIRYKWDSLKVAGYASITLWTIFAGLLYLFEYQDATNAIDPVPLYASCTEDCTMMDRFQNYFDGFFFTGIHLTGDYPITTYSWPAKIVNFFMVVAAVGVVSIPSGLIASGFEDIVQSKQTANDPNKDSNALEGDDWYEIEYRALEGVPPPASKWGPRIDGYQTAVDTFLNGTKDEATGKTKYTPFALFGRVFIFAVIIANIVAVMVESVPRIDKAVGNEPGNFFDVFEAFSIGVFTLEYFSRLFCAPKNREALYSSWVYARTFFGIVDLLSTAPWYIESILMATGTIAEGGDVARIFRIFRIARLLQLEDFVTAFSKLDNVFRASADVLKSCFLLALIIWVGGGSLFFIFERNNPNFRECDDSIPLLSNGTAVGCYDFPSTLACNEYYGEGMCDQTVFVNLPNTLYMTAVFLGGEWGVTDFTWPGRILCILFCYVGIALYAIPAGTFFDKFGAVLGLDGDDDDENDGDDDEA